MYAGGKNMETKQLYVANINIVFGKEEEPLIERVDDIIIPALTSGIVKKSGEKTRFIFEDVLLREIEEDEWVIQGLFIKDTVLDVMSEYSPNTGLEKTEKHINSAPYSLFIIYLKNHRMVLVKNQSSSPDIRNFASAFKEIIGAYVRKENEHLDKGKKLPKPIIFVSGIKTAASVKETLKDVEKINQLLLKFYPLNAEWDYDPIFGEIDQKIRKTIQSKKGRMIFSSPQSKDGVADIIERTEGIVKSEMKVTYKGANPEDENKKTGTIRDDQISDVLSVDIYQELDSAYDEINSIGKSIHSINFQTKNHIIDYKRFLEKRKKDR